MRVVDALAVVRSSRFDLPLTYRTGDFDLRVGEIVRAELGSREVLGFVVSPVRDEAEPRKLKRVLERLDVPRAFDDVGLHLASFVAERYICTLGEALSAIVLADALPRVRELLERGPAPDPRRFRSIPTRLIRLIWEELDASFPLERLLRHPEARRSADRGGLLRHVSALVRAGALRRLRTFTDPRTREYRVRTLRPGTGRIAGSRAEALVRFVEERGQVARSEATLAGFSTTVITRAISAGAIAERLTKPERSRERKSGVQPLLPTAEQREALSWIESAVERGEYAAALLHGVTGSGKTYVYIAAIERVLRKGGRAIVLVPEISLTVQAAQRFESAFGDRVAVLHSALSERERFEAWQACARGEVDVVVGPRSAVFAPLPNVRLLIVDESHDPSYKQESVPRYHAVAVARARMRRENGVLVLGSATPSLESYAAAESGALTLLRLRLRATSQPMPSVRIVDLRAEFEAGSRRIFSSTLVQALSERLERGEKSVLFVNRRGSAGSLLCRNCGRAPQCPRCSVSLTVHRSEGLLRCHYCDYQGSMPRVCPNCGAENIRELGIGTERVAEELARLFPDARVLRMDSDTTTHVGDHARILSAFESRGDVLVGTQMVAKGLDYPTVTLAAVVAADLGLNLPDFRAAERSFALIAQVCGRSGRGRRGEAIVQTYLPEHPAVVCAAEHDYDGFASGELRERIALGFPPARRLVYIGVLSRDRRAALAQAEAYAQTLRDADLADVLGPAPYPVARVNNEWRYRIALKTEAAAALRATIRARVLPAARASRATRIAINVDP